MNKIRDGLRESGAQNRRKLLLFPERIYVKLVVFPFSTLHALYNLPERGEKNTLNNHFSLFNTGRDPNIQPHG